jgi:hypothetical protein
MREVFGGERWVMFSEAIVVDSQPQGKQSLASNSKYDPKPMSF